MVECQAATTRNQFLLFLGNVIRVFPIAYVFVFSAFRGAFMEAQFHVESIIFAMQYISFQGSEARKTITGEALY